MFMAVISHYTAVKSIASLSLKFSLELWENAKSLCEEYRLRLKRGEKKTTCPFVSSLTVLTDDILYLYYKESHTEHIFYEPQ
jgi:hypothetical protein